MESNGMETKSKTIKQSKKMFKINQTNQPTNQQTNE